MDKSAECLDIVCCGSRFSETTSGETSDTLPGETIGVATAAAAAAVEIIGEIVIVIGLSLNHDRIMHCMIPSKPFVFSYGNRDYDRRHDDKRYGRY